MKSADIRMTAPRQDAHAAPCQHELVELQCPFCSRTVDEDHRFCGTCHEGVDPVRYCPDCEEELGTLGDYEQEVRLLQQLTDSLAAAKEAQFARAEAASRARAKFGDTLPGCSRGCA